MGQLSLSKRIVLRLVLKILWYASILLYRFTFHGFLGFGCHLLFDFCGASFSDIPSRSRLKCSASAFLSCEHNA